MATSKVHALKRILVNFILSMDCKNAVFKRKRQFYRCSYKEWPFERGSVRNSYGILLRVKGGLRLTQAQNQAQSGDV